MRSSIAFLFLVAAGTAAAEDAFGPRATAYDWIAEYEGSERRQAWAKQWAGPGAHRLDTLPADRLEICLDHITSDENGKVPPKVGKIPLFELTLWCKQQVDPHLEDPDHFRRKTFRYPEGMIPLGW